MLKEEKPRINVTFDADTYNKIKLIADKNHRSMSDVVRDWSLQGLSGTLTQENIDILVPIIRDQLSSILFPAVDRLAALSAKTCVQAGAAAYLSAEAISRFVPMDLQQEVLDSYEAARKKAVRYMKGNANLDEE